jgi:DNA-binding NtrC family response regulator
MSLAMQSKILRVLQERTMERVGGTRPVSVYCRLIAATNKDINDLRARGLFREDLYYRLSTVTLRLPPLRDRAADIPGLVRLFVDEANASYGRGVRRVPDHLMQLLCAHPWPGNIRQLKNVITNAVILSEGTEIAALSFGDAMDDGRLGGPAPDGAAAHDGYAAPDGHVDGFAVPGDLRATMARASARMEKKMIATALEASEGNVSRAAERLGISRKTLYEKMRRHGL